MASFFSDSFPKQFSKQLLQSVTVGTQAEIYLSSLDMTICKDFQFWLPEVHCQKFENCLIQHGLQSFWSFFSLDPKCTSCRVLAHWSVYIPVNLPTSLVLTLGFLAPFCVMLFPMKLPFFTLPWLFVHSY